jgi:hypothetical protein
MRPIDSAYDTAAAASTADAEAVLDTDTAQPGETVSYEDWEVLDDLGRDTMRQRLAKRDMGLHDNSCDMVVVWLCAENGDRLDPERDDVTESEQPAEARQ